MLVLPPDEVEDWEGLPRRTGHALVTLVDVGGSVGRGLVVTLEAEEGDLVADCVVLGVDTELVDALGALETAGELVLGVDDLVRGGNDDVGGGEVVGLSATETKLEVEVEVKVQVETEAEETALLAVVLVTKVEEGAGLGGGSEDSGGNGGGLHFDGWEKMSREQGS